VQVVEDDDEMAIVVELTECVGEVMHEQPVPPVRIALARDRVA